MSITGKILSISKIALIASLSTLVAILAVASLLLFTHTGNQGLIKIAKQLESRFSVELKEGSLFNQPKYKNISWLDGDLSIQIDSLEYQFEWSCLTSKLCLQTLSVNGASINIPETTTQTEIQEEVDSEPLVIQLPIEIAIENIDLTDVFFTMGQLKVELGSLALKADAANNNISLSSQINNLLVTLPDSEKLIVKKSNRPGLNANKKMDLNIKSIPAILTEKMLPTVKLPVNLDIKPITISQFKLNTKSTNTV